MFGFSAFLEHDLLDKNGNPVDTDRIFKRVHDKKMTSFESITGKQFAADEVLNKARQWLIDNGHTVTDVEEITDYEKGLFPKYEEKSRDTDWIKYSKKRK